MEATAATLREKAASLIAEKNALTERITLLEDRVHPGRPQDLKARVREFLNDDADYEYYSFYNDTLGGVSR